MCSAMVIPIVTGKRPWERLTWQLEQEMTLVEIQIEHEKKKAAITGRTKSGKRARGLRGCLLNQSRREKWNWFAQQMLERIGMEVTPDQCTHKWDNLKQAYKCIKRVKEITGGRTYFEMEKEELRTVGKEHGLQAMPPTFSPELYDLLATTMALSDEALEHEKLRPKGKPRKREKKKKQADGDGGTSSADGGGSGALLDPAAEAAARDAEAAAAAKEVALRHQERARGLLATFCECMDRVLGGGGGEAGDDGGGEEEVEEEQQREQVRREVDQLRQRAMGELLEEGLALEAEVAAAMIAQLETAGQALIALSYGKAPFSWLPDAMGAGAAGGDAASGPSPVEDLDVPAALMAALPLPLPATAPAAPMLTAPPPPDVPPALWPPIPLAGFAPPPAAWQSSALAGLPGHLPAEQGVERLS